LQHANQLLWSPTGIASPRVPVNGPPNPQGKVAAEDDVVLEGG
jgi:hypothetical protein